MIAGLTHVQILEYFLIYSFGGWCLEVVYQAVSKGMVINRGFLNGPICPIYGCGVIAILMTLYSLFGSDFESVNGCYVFAFGIVLATFIELLGGWILDKLFHARWWDYRDRPFNLHGYICLQFSIIWGLCIVFVIREIHPLVVVLFGCFPQNLWKILLLVILYVIFFGDITLSALIMIGLNKRFAELDEMQKRMRVVSNHLSTRIGEETLERMHEAEEMKERADEIKEQVEEMKEHAELQLDALLGRKLENEEELAQWTRELMELRKNTLQDIQDRREELLSAAFKHRFVGVGRLLRAFPQMEHHEYDEILKELLARMNQEIPWERKESQK